MAEAAVEDGNVFYTFVAATLIWLISTFLIYKFLKKSIISKHFEKNDKKIAAITSVILSFALLNLIMSIPVSYILDRGYFDVIITLYGLIILLYLAILLLYCIFLVVCYMLLLLLAIISRIGLIFGRKRLFVWYKRLGDKFTNFTTKYRWILGIIYIIGSLARVSSGRGFGGGGFSGGGGSFGGGGSSGRW